MTSGIIQMQALKRNVLVRLTILQGLAVSPQVKSRDNGHQEQVGKGNKLKGVGP